MYPGTQHSSLITRHAAACSDQPLASSVALEVLRMGGNAADAGVAMITAVSLLQPFTCGLGGDMHCIFFKASDKSVVAINGSGKNGQKATLGELKKAGIDSPDDNNFKRHGLWVTVPGAVAAMHHIVERFGSRKLTMEQILSPVIKYADEGVPVPRKAAKTWQSSGNLIMTSKNFQDILPNSRLPEAGDLLFFPKLIQTLKNIAKYPEAFYVGAIAMNIVDEVQAAGGVLELQDLENYFIDCPSSQPWETLHVDFKGFRIWEMKPNTIGIVLLVALNVLKIYDLKELGHNSADYIHLLVEVIKYSFLESWDYLCDPENLKNPPEYLLSDEIADKIRREIDNERCKKVDFPLIGGNTSYACVVDSEGNGCSIISSISSSFGSCLIPPESGFILHDRAKCFSLDEKSPNSYGPNKLCLHSLVPSLVTDPETGDLVAVFGVMGRYMQPQGHLQVLLNMLIFGMDPQEALNQPRFFVGRPNIYSEYTKTFHQLCLEAGIDSSIVDVLRSKGHDCESYPDSNRSPFGKGHVITRQRLFDPKSPADNDVWWSGVDPRSDGLAAGY